MAKISVFESQFQRVAVIGSNGKLGSYFAKLLLNLSYREIVSVKIQYVNGNLNKSESLLSNLLKDSHVAINCIGLVGVNICAEEYKLAESLNGYLPEFLGNICKVTGTKFVQVSTPSVFSGRKPPYYEGDLPDAVSVYGQSKALGENLVLKANPESMVVRINFLGVFPSHDNIGSKFIHHALRNQSISAYTNSIFSPTYVDSIARKILFMAESVNSGIFHLNNPTITSKYQFATDVYRELNRDPNLVKPAIFDHQNYSFSPDTTLKSSKLSNADLNMTTKEIIEKLLEDYTLVIDKRI